MSAYTDDLHAARTERDESTRAVKAAERGRDRATTMTARMAANRTLHDARVRHTAALAAFADARAKVGAS